MMQYGDLFLFYIYSILYSFYSLVLYVQGLNM